jgi:NADH dehydrogenase/NADH:ubiquinone oxidoreductase subunit G
MWQEGWDADWFKLVTACNHPVKDGLVVVTDSPRVVETRTVVVDLLLARCPDTPLIQEMAADYGVERSSFVPRAEADDCILCGLCTRVCDHIGVSAIASVNRGWGREIAPPFHQAPPACIGCLACAEVCPTDCIPFTTGAAKRSIWGKDFQMLRCSGCGRAHITVAQADHWATLKDVPRSYFETCDVCKRAAHARTFVRLQPASIG